MFLLRALDVETEQRLWDRLFAPESDPARRPACLIASHRRAVLRRADQIVVLKGGGVASVGTLDELFDSCAEFRRLWDGA